MIRRLTGQVVAVEQQNVVLALGSAPKLCVEIQVPDPQSPELEVGAEVTLITYLHVRPEELSLFGFLSEEDHQIFRRLIRVNGVGPRAALGMLGALSPDTLIQAILHNEPKVIAQAPGIGPRTAQKIILELADRISDIATLTDGFALPVDKDADILAVLTQMGFSASEASRALGQIPEEVKDEGDRLRLALQNLG